LTNALVLIFPEAYNRLLMGLQIQTIRYESLPSTNTEVARLATQGAAEGLSVIADEQTAGRGRLQRNWSSPRGAGLYFSMLLRPILPFHLWPLVTFAAALAASDALAEGCGLPTDIKWPNDLLAGERKICGILSETVETPQGRAIVVGIGINLRNGAYPGDLRTIATSVAEATGKAVETEEILGSLQKSLSHWYSLLQENDGPQKVLETWTTRSSYASGKVVDIINGEETFRGVTRGLESDGALRVETEAEGIRVVRAGDVVSLKRPTEIQTDGIA
jgi:BirA family transcriptional regulator, biotin operon repressor / biotin---[acetyl-CoA-carboxylase] ligase